MQSSKYLTTLFTADDNLLPTTPYPPPHKKKNKKNQLRKEGIGKYEIKKKKEPISCGRMLHET